MNDDRFLTFKDIQDRFEVSRTTLWRWRCARNGLRVYTVGRISRVKERDLQEFLDRHMQGNPEAN